MTTRGSKFSAFRKGTLESSSLAEVAHFIKKAKQQLEYAKYALDNADFEYTNEVLSPVENKISEISHMIVETRRAIEIAAARIVDESNESDEREALKQEKQELEKRRQQFL